MGYLEPKVVMERKWLDCQDSEKLGQKIQEVRPINKSLMRKNVLKCL